MRAWLADHLAWLTAALVALWAPPVLFTIAVNLGIVPIAAHGYATFADPALVTSIAQVLLMTIAVPGLARGRAWAWRVLAAAVAAWAAHAGWVVLGRVRLSGMRTVVAPESLLALVGVTVAALAVGCVRRRFLAPGGPAQVP